MERRSTELNNENFEDILKKMKGIKVAFLCAITTDGITSRPMVAHFDPNDETSVYFISSSDSGQIDAFMSNPEATAVMTDSSNNIYIEIKGQCHLTKSKDKIQPFWSEITETWFPDGLQNSDVSLIKLSISSLECWDSSGNLLTKAASMIYAKLTQTVPDLGDHTSVKI